MYFMIDIVQVGGRYRMHQKVRFGSFSESEAVMLHIFMFGSQVHRENTVVKATSLTPSLMCMAA